MIIGIDLSEINPNYVGGVNSFSIGLVESIIKNVSVIEDNRHLVCIFTSKKSQHYIGKLFSANHLRVKFVQLPTTNFSRLINKIVACVGWLTRIYTIRIPFDTLFRRDVRKLIDSNCDVLYCPTTVLNFFNLRVPSVLSIHDIQHEDLPSNFKIKTRIGRWAIYRLSAKCATFIQVSSQFIADSILKNYLFVPQFKLVLIPEGVSDYWFDKSYHISSFNTILDKKFILYPAQLWVHKNHSLLLDSLAIVKHKLGIEVQCVLVGSDMGQLTSINNKLSELRLGNVVYLGKVDVSLLKHLYSMCSIVLALGDYESSSLPIKEAAAQCKPVIAANIPPNLELSKYLPVFPVELDKESLASLIIKLLTSDIYLESSSFTYVYNFTWTKIADRYLQLFERCVS